MENTLEQEWYQYFTQLNDEERKSVLQMLKTFMKRNTVSERITIEQYNNELEASERQIEAGNYTTQEDLKKEMENW